VVCIRGAIFADGRSLLRPLFGIDLVVFHEVLRIFEINMGIKGLKSFVAGSVTVPPQELDPSEIHLHIDISGFLFYLYHNKLSANDAPKELGGSYFVL
jgi:hypothetical protein